MSTAWAVAALPPALGGDELHVWLVALDPPPASLARLAGRLSPDERRRAARFRFERDRRRFQAARGALRELLAGYLGERPERIRFVEGRHGKPELAEAGSALRFNVSHSGERALCALSLGRELGVDIEQLRELADAEALARRFFSAAESAELAAIPEPQRLAAFFRCWTRKEAYLKAVGAGLLQPLADFDVSLLPELGACAFNFHGRPEETARWSLLALDVGAGYVGALMAERPPWRLVCLTFAHETEAGRLASAAGP